MKKFYIFALCIVGMLAQKMQIDAVKTSVSPIIDGAIESVWDQSEWYTGFFQTEPYPKEAATKKTQFKLLYNSENVYFLVYSFSDPESIISVGGTRDSRMDESDYITISIDPLYDKNTGYQFTVNPSNVQSDGRLFADSKSDSKWNATWYSKTSRMLDGWVAEIRIPLRDIKFQKSELQTWGVMIRRNIRINRESVYWPMIDPEIGFRVSQFAEINNLNGLLSKNEINFIPSAVAIFDNKKEYDPFDNDRIVGLDLRYNFDEQHSILATIRPDFSQIESDDDQINISDYPLALAERRPFFLKGNNLYETPGDLLYTRRITKPNFGTKFFGSSDHFKYGVTYVNNEGLLLDSLGDFTSIKNSENFIVPRLKYLPNNETEIGYLGGFLISDKAESGQLHEVDAILRPTDQITVVGMYATTSLDKNSQSNSNFGGNVEYSSDTWESEVSYQRISTHFRNDLIGFPEATNKAAIETQLSRRIRFRNSSIRDINLQAEYEYNGTQDLEIPTSRVKLEFKLNQKSKTLGQIRYGGSFSYKNGYFRNYVADSVSGQTYIDNYGRFQGISDKGSSFNVYFDSDFSWPFAAFLALSVNNYKQTDIYNIRNNYQWKPTDDWLIRFEITIEDIQGSEFLEKETLSKYNFKVNYLLQDNLFFKIFMQYNSQQQRLSNNFVVNYEYDKGSFLYLAYNETGYLEDNYMDGPLIKNYNLDRRTISLKWTYSIYY